MSTRVHRRIALSLTNAIEETELAINYLEHAGHQEPADDLREVLKAITSARTKHPVLVGPIPERGDDEPALLDRALMPTFSTGITQED